MHAPRRRDLVIASLSLLLTVCMGQVAAQTILNGPYYATPSWDQTLPANVRFIVLANMESKAVLDRETGLVWERTPSEAAFAVFSEAEFFGCSPKTFGGRKGWRVPSVWELSTLIDSTQTNPPLPAGHPFNLGSGEPRFWTNTPLSVGFGAGTVWIVSFISNGFSGTTGPGNGRRVWCVRGPGGTAPFNPAMQ